MAPFYRYNEINRSHNLKFLSLSHTLHLLAHREFQNKDPG